MTGRRRWRTPTSEGIVPLTERQQYLSSLRLALGVTVVGVLVFAPHLLGEVSTRLLPATLLYLLFATAAMLWWRRSRRHHLLLFGVTLIFDGLYLAWLVALTGGELSPFRYAILLHLIAVALLASYRTSLKLALWHSLLALVAFHLDNPAVSSSLVSDGSAAEWARLEVFIVALWLVAVATATLSAVNERELRRRRYDMEALAEFASAIDHLRAPTAIAQTFLLHVCRAFGFSRAVLVDDQHGAPILLAQRGCAPFRGGYLPAPESLLARARRVGSTLLVGSVAGENEAWLDEVMPEARNLVVVPLSADDRVLATLVAEHGRHRSPGIGQRIVSMVERFAAHAALALHNAALVDQLEQAAATDGLTQLANRRTFDRVLRQELERSVRSDEPVSLLLLDLDHFKRLNDSHGHQAGDDVLRQAGALLSAACRPFDTAARYGGEEFAVILPRCDAAEAAGIGERLRRTLAAITEPTAVTASAGVATTAYRSGDAVALIKAADAALYASKKTGRDRLTVARSDEVPAAQYSAHGVANETVRTAAMAASAGGGGVHA